MTPSLVEIKAAAEKATPGPWGDPGWQALVPVSYEDGGDEGRVEAQANSAFIALSRTAVPWLVERVEELSEALEWLARLYPHDPYEWHGGNEHSTMCPTCVVNKALARLEDE